MNSLPRKGSRNLSDIAALPVCPGPSFQARRLVLKQPPASCCIAQPCTLFCNYTSFELKSPANLVHCTELISCTRSGSPEGLVSSLGLSCKQLLLWCPALSTVGRLSPVLRSFTSSWSFRETFCSMPFWAWRRSSCAPASVLPPFCTCIHTELHHKLQHVTGIAMALGWQQF